MIQEAKALFIKVREEKATTYRLQRRLYGGTVQPCVGDPKNRAGTAGWSGHARDASESILASAYQMTGCADQAKLLQVGIYQNIVVLFNFFPAYLMLCADDKVKFEEALRRALNVAESFDMKHLHPGVLVGLYISAAQGYMMQGNREKALDILQKYAEIVTGDIYPLRLHEHF